MNVHCKLCVTLNVSDHLKGTNFKYQPPCWLKSELLLLFSFVSFSDSTEVLLETAPSSSVFSSTVGSTGAGAGGGGRLSSATSSLGLSSELSGGGGRAVDSALGSMAALSASAVKDNEKHSTMLYSEVLQNINTVFPLWIIVWHMRVKTAWMGCELLNIFCFLGTSRHLRTSSWALGNIFSNFFWHFKEQLIDSECNVISNPGMDLLTVKKTQFMLFNFNRKLKLLQWIHCVIFLETFLHH